MVRKIFILSLIIFPLFTSLGLYSQQPFCSQIASYTMNVYLDTKNNFIKGEELLSWTNNTQTPVQELWFHLYWNAFQNNMSTFLREAREGTNIADFKKDDWGFCHIQSIKIVQNSSFEEYNLIPWMEYRHPDDENLYDQTVLSVTLPHPVEPGQTIMINIDFKSKVPRPIDRTGVWKDYYFIAQWFPKIGVYQNGQWNCHQYHADSEYFADYGTYDVKITLPSSYIVGATGEHREKIDNGDGTTTHHFYQHSVHDFAWTASSRFLEYKENYEFSPGKSTEITLLLQPHHKKLKKRYLAAIKNALKYCSLFFGDYPYSTVTCVDPAYNSRSGGMEYPTFFTGDAYFLSKKGIPSPEEVTIHEFGHNYFYGLVGSNEFENPWMDEGFTSFLDTEIYYAAYGQPLYYKMYFGLPVTFQEVKIPIESEEISSHRLTYNLDNMQHFAWQFMSEDSYVANSYAKAELMLRTLQRYMGKELFSQMIKAYSQRFWFKHPRPADFYQTVSEFAGQDMNWFLDQFIYGSEKLDYAIDSLSCHHPAQPRGWFEGKYREGSRPQSLESIFESEVIVRRLGGVKIPVDVLAVFEDGKKVKKKWDGQYRWKKFSFKYPFKIKKAVVDPDFKLVLDINRTNNSRMRKANLLAPWKWMSNWLIWLQHALEMFTIFGG